jgi:hypothetical protein
MLSAQTDCSIMEGDWNEQPKCEDFNAFRIAAKAGDREKCGDSMICRVMMGQGSGICREFAKKARAEYCEAFLPPEKRVALVPESRSEQKTPPRKHFTAEERMQALSVEANRSCSRMTETMQASLGKAYELLNSTTTARAPGREARLKTAAALKEASDKFARATNTVAASKEP